MVAELAILQNPLWALCQAGLLVLLVFLVRYQNYSRYPHFTAYILLNLGQAIVLLLTYRSWGFLNVTSFQIAWITQGLTLIARALAIAELCRRILGGYRGVWALAWRMLAVCAAVIVSYSFLIANWRWEVAIFAADRGLELAIASLIVLLFVFMRYYGMAVAGPDRALAVGFCIYSCAIVLNNTFLMKYLFAYSTLWNLVMLFAFLVSLAIWIAALRFPVPISIRQPALMDGVLYRQLSPEINLRLRVLNEQLLSIWKPETPHS